VTLLLHQQNDSAHCIHQAANSLQLQFRSAAHYSDLSSKLSAAAADISKHGQTASKALAEAAEARQLLALAGLTNAAAAQDMQQALSQGVQAHTEQQQLRDEQQRLQQRITALESDRTAQADVMKVLRAETTQLQQRAGLEEGQAEFVAWAPADMSPDTVQHLSEAAGISSNTFRSVERRFVAGSASSSRGGGTSSSGAAGPGSSQQQRSRGKPQMALYVVRLVSSRYLHAALGGRCRMALSSRQLPIWVERSLTKEERAMRARYKEVAQRLRAEGNRLRWGPEGKLPRLEVTAGGKKTWKDAMPTAPPEGVRAAEVATGGGAGGVQ